MPGGIHHFDPSRLQATSKFIDPGYAPKTVVVPATSELRKPLRGCVWHDKASGYTIKRRFSARQIRFADTVARRIDAPLLAKEMVLFDEKRMYLDTSIELEYSPKYYLPAVTQRCAEAIKASVDAPVDDQFREDTLLISHHEGGGTWGHYLIQSIPRMLLFLDAFPSGKIAIPTWHAQGAPGYGEALAFYNIPTERLARIEASTVYRFKEAILLDFLFNFKAAAPHPKVLPFLRSVPLCHNGAEAGNKAAFIKRRADTHRLIGNESAVDAVMARHRIDVYGPDSLPLRTQIELWQSHDLVITTLGSDLTNMVYARAGTRVLVLSPHWFGDIFFFELSVAAGVRWYELRCGDMAWRAERAEGDSSFNVEADLLDTVLTSLLS
jgi:capsular polysaccharide biosynthesis protein